MITVAITNDQSRVPVDARRITAAARQILADAKIDDAEVSVAVVDNDRIHELNRRHLQHDCPTDVLSFLLEREAGRLEGEVIVSADTAAEEAPRYEWAAEDEMLLYVIHGLLHLIGHDDRDPDSLRRMRRAERQYLAAFDLHPTYSSPGDDQP